MANHTTTYEVIAMATHNVNDVLVLSKEVVEGLKKMRAFGSKIYGELKLAKARDYAQWVEALDQSNVFWEEIRYREKLAVAMAENESISASHFDIINLSNFIEAAEKLLKQIEPILHVNEQVNNYKYQIDGLTKFFESINKKAHSVTNEVKL